jgi:CMP/dCMP kinase
MIITITGNPGSGKSSIAKILEKKLAIKRYYIGQILRDIAKERGIDINQLMEAAKTDSSIDKEVDDYQIKLGKEKDNIIVEGRTSFHFIPNSLKIYLMVDWKEAAKRVIKDMAINKEKRNEDYFDDIDKQQEFLIKRHERDRQRYKEYYGIDIDDLQHYDIIVDTTNIGIEECSKRVLELIEIEKND